MKPQKYMSTQELYRRIKTANQLINDEKKQRYPRNWYTAKLLQLIEDFQGLIDEREEKEAQAS